MKTGYSYRFKGFHCILNRSDTPGYLLNDHNIGLTKELENALVVLCRNSIILIVYTKYKTLAVGKTDTATPTATNATSNISNTSLTSGDSASDSTTSYLIYANKITVCS